MKHKKRNILALLCLFCLLSLTACKDTKQIKEEKNTISETTQMATIETEPTTDLDVSTEYATTEVPTEGDADTSVEDVTTMTTKDETATTELSKEDLLAELLSRESGQIIAEEEIEKVGYESFFYKSQISDEVFGRIDGVSFGEGCVMERSDLRYLRVLHYGFDDQTHVGELICNKNLADDFLEIFEKLYLHDYPIEKMLLVDEYGGDDELSMEDNNTSCFNFRSVPGQTHLSQHAYGRAIDINPLYNPYITSDGYTPVNAGDYVDRSKDTPYKIDYDDYCYEIFDEYGFTWGGNWNSVKDYQHFQRKKGE